MLGRPACSCKFPASSISTPGTALCLLPGNAPRWGIPAQTAGTPGVCGGWVKASRRSARTDLSPTHHHHWGYLAGLYDHNYPQSARRVDISESCHCLPPLSCITEAQATHATLESGVMRVWLRALRGGSEPGALVARFAVPFCPE